MFDELLISSSSTRETKQKYYNNKTKKKKPNKIRLEKFMILGDNMNDIERQ